MFKKTLFVILCTIVVVSCAIGLNSSHKNVEFFGEPTSIYTEIMKFEGSEIESLEKLETELLKLPNLKECDLGTFLVHADKSKGFQNTFPNTKFTYNTYVELYGDIYLTNVTAIDLSQKQIDDSYELINKAHYFTNVENIILGENLFPAEERDALVNAYSTANVQVVATHNIYGLTVREDVTELDLQGVGIDNCLSEKLRLLPSLTYVNMKGHEGTREEMIALAKQFPQIAFNWLAPLGDGKYDSLNTELTVNNSWKYDFEKMQEEFVLFPYLKKLRFESCGMSNEEFAAFREKSERVEIVWTLRMGRWSLKTDATAFSVLIYDYSHKRLHSSDIEVLKYTTNLQALDLGHQALTDLSAIPKYCPELRVLILADNVIKDLSPLAELKHLHYLEFFVNQVTDVTPLASCKELVDLNISYNHGLADITPLLNFPKLERLWLEHCRVSAADVQLLRETYPNAKIVSEGRGSIDQGWRTHDRYFAMIDMYHNDYISELFTKYDGKEPLEDIEL